MVEPNPDFLKSLKNKNRNAWILPHCLSTQKKVEIVDFDAAAFNGGIINPGKILPSDLGRRVPRDKRLPHERTIKVRCKAKKLHVKKYAFIKKSTILTQSL